MTITNIILTNQRRPYKSELQHLQQKLDKIDMSYHLRRCVNIIGGAFKSSINWCVSNVVYSTQLALVAGFPAGVQLAPGASPRLRNSFLSPAPWLRASEGAAAERGMNRAELSDSFRLFWRGWLMTRDTWGRHADTAPTVSVFSWSIYLLPKIKKIPSRLTVS